MKMLASIKELLLHIKEVEQSTIDMTKESTLVLSSILEQHNIELDTKSAKVLQYQDIISQQLSATIEAIESIAKSIEIFERAYASDEIVASTSVEKLKSRLENTLEEAKSKRDAFRGNVDKQEDSIEFF